MKLVYVEGGIANRFPDGTIEMNKHLKDYPKLHRAILDHELRHTDKAFSKKDLINDFRPSKISQKDMISFMIKYPKSLSQFLPFYWTKKHGFVYDINLIIFYCLFVSFIISMIFIARYYI